MKIALLGDGKTGRYVKELHKDVVVFNLKNPPNLDKLKECDVVISFLPGEAFTSYIDMLIESNLPVATGSTGFSWPDGVNEKLIESNVAWIASSNFSLGMTLVQQMIEVLSRSGRFYKDVKASIHEIHHVQKKDAPSGTALLWQDWLGLQTEITSERTGDIVGDHKLTLDTEFEAITLQHQAKSRKIFARGAIWCAEQLVKGNVSPGLNSLTQVAKLSVEETDA